MGDLYDRSIEVRFLARLRPELKFDSVGFTGLKHFFDGFFPYLDQVFRKAKFPVGFAGELFSRDTRLCLNDRVGIQMSAFAIETHDRIDGVFGESRCFDVIERTLYNHYLGAIALHGLGTFYYNPMRIVGDQSEKTDHWHRPSTARGSQASSSCS